MLGNHPVFLSLPVAAALNPINADYSIARSAREEEETARSSGWRIGTQERQNHHLFSSLSDAAAPNPINAIAPPWRRRRSAANESNVLPTSMSFSLLSRYVHRKISQPRTNTFRVPCNSVFSLRGSPGKFASVTSEQALTFH